MTASALAGELKLPLFSVQLHGLITKFMGETAAKLHAIFEAMTLTPELAALAESAAAELGLQVAGVDLLPGNTGPLICEVNGSPGLEGIQRTIDTDLSDNIVSFLASCRA